jgi:hypothetical protein
MKILKILTVVEHNGSKYIYDEADGIWMQDVHIKPLTELWYIYRYDEKGMHCEYPPKTEELDALYQEAKGENK